MGLVRSNKEFQLGNYGKTSGKFNKEEEHDFMEKKEVGRDSKVHLRKQAFRVMTFSLTEL